MPLDTAHVYVIVLQRWVRETKREGQNPVDTQPIDPDLFHSTAPKWNCVGYPGDGMHYTPGPNGRCVWCGKSRDQITAERAARETEPGGMIA